MKIKKLERTGKVYSIASSEFMITYEDDTTETIWSPPWHDMSEKEEYDLALEKAREIAKTRKKKSPFVQLTIEEMERNDGD